MMIINTQARIRVPGNQYASWSVVIVGSVLTPH
jgi:hypothetical protein